MPTPVDYILHLADSSLIMGHRLSEWTGHGPSLEQDIAISNIALDLIGQSRNFYQYAAILNGEGATEDGLAYLRDANEFKNLLITELPRGDWGYSILKLFFFSCYQNFLYEQLSNSTDEQIAAIAVKSLKEVKYHVRWSSEWVLRMGDGTAESHERIQDSLNELWSYTGEFFEAAPYEAEAFHEHVGVDVSRLKTLWMKKVSDIITEATLHIPFSGHMHSGGKTGVHMEHLTNLLAEMQYLQRAYPGCEW